MTGTFGDENPEVDPLEESSPTPESQPGADAPGDSAESGALPARELTPFFEVPATSVNAARAAIPPGSSSSLARSSTGIEVEVSGASGIGLRGDIYKRK